MKKLIAILLILATLFTVMACADNGKGGKNETTPESTEDEYPLEIKDFGGAPYRVSMMSADAYKEFYIMEDSETSTDSALYKRNVKVQDLYNVSITPVIVGAEGLFGHTNAIVNSILSDNDEFDLVTSFAFAAGPLIMNTCLYDLKAQDNIDLDASYWLKEVNDQFVIEDHLYTAVGDTSVYALLYTYAMMFNKTKADAEGITAEVFDKIDNNKWTIDYFNNLVSGLYDDIDDESGKTYEDFYGFRANTLTDLDTFNFAFDITMLDTSGTDGELIKFVYGGERLAKAVDKINDLYWENTGTNIGGDHIDCFVRGKAMFSTILLNDCFTTLKGMEDDYIVLPYPMLDEEQDGYRTGMMDNYYVMGIPISTPDADMASLITEAMNYEAEKTMYPVYFDEALKSKYVRDERTIKMLDLLLEGRTADFGTLLQNNLDNISVWFRWMVQSKDRDSKTYVDNYRESITAKIEAVIDKYREGAA